MRSRFLRVLDQIFFDHFPRNLAGDFAGNLAGDFPRDFAGDLARLMSIDGCRSIDGDRLATPGFWPRHHFYFLTILLGIFLGILQGI